MNRLTVSTVALMTVAIATPVLSQTLQGRWQVKAMAAAVLPDGAIARVERDAIGLPAGSQTEASDAYIPTLAVEWFVSPRVSVETLCSITPHDVEGDGALDGAALIEDAIILPAAVTAKYHFFGRLDGVKPYVGAGVTHFFIFEEGVGRDAAALGATAVDLSSEFGAVLQAGVDIPLPRPNLSFRFDAKRYFVGTTATFSAGDAVALRSEHDLDPWVVSAGLAYRF